MSLIYFQLLFMDVVESLFSLSFTQRLYMKQSKFVRRINREKIKILNYLADGVFPLLTFSLCLVFPFRKTFV